MIIWILLTIHTRHCNYQIENYPSCLETRTEVFDNWEACAIEAERENAAVCVRGELR